ncbi:NADP-dependent oxidoreductase [Streptomyces sp. NPDC127020]|uniref:NADP-dependent oxidoreductase n=1 Tax=Streptomyces sp. NPDC127020 TaxID=3347109 RepID=UPI0036553483
MGATMKAVSQQQLGGPEVLETVTRERPAPGIGQILIRVRAAGVNPVDSMNRQTGTLVGEPPFVLGYDVSGTVETVGPGVTVHRAGDEVFGMLPFPRGLGGYAQYVTAPARAFVPKPANVTHVQAAALPLAGLTAYQALVDTAGVGPGSRVLVNGSAGGVGHLAVQIAKARGAHVIALASKANEEFVRALGADEVIDHTTDPDLAVLAPALDAVLETIGGDYPARAVRALRSGGVLVSTLPPTLAPAAAEAAEREVRLAGLFVEADRLGMTALAELVAAGRLVPTVAATYPLERAGEAQASKAGPGKTVLTVA